MTSASTASPESGVHARDWLLLAAGIALLAALPLVASNYVLRLATIVAMYAVLAQSWNFIGGLAGYPSFATAAFFGLGAYVAAVLQSKGVALPFAWVAAGITAAVFAALVGGAILHLRGHYFAIASLVIAEVLREIVNTTPDITGGGMGLNLPVMRLGVTEQARIFYHAMLGLFAITFAVALLVHRGKLGFALRCIRQNEDAANILGVDTTLAKAAAFTLSAAFVGVAGAIYASWTHYIDPTDVFDVLLSVKPLVMVLLGGVGTLMGPVIGAAILLTLEELVWRNFLTLHAAALGIIIVALVLFLPNGLLPLLRRVFSARRAGAA
jgi:branched-chain amino acid transport system permease protein